MRKFFLFILLFTSAQIFAQSSQVSWYKMLSGKIGNYPIDMHLHKSGHTYSGFYYYNSQQQPVYFTGEDTTVKGTIILSAFSGAENMEKFSFMITDRTAKGSWSKTEKSKPLTLLLTETAPSIGMDYIYTKGATPLRPKMKESPQASFEAASIWPKGNSSTDTFLKALIRKSFAAVFKDNEEIGPILLREKKLFFDGYLKDNNNVKEADLKESSFAYNMDETSELLIAYQSPKILTLAQYVYSYTGGAHGNYGTTYTSIDISSNKELELSDVITNQGKAALSKLLEKYFRKMYHIEPSASLESGGLFENKIEPNENFYITGKGIGFSYTPYEIGPYAMGEINIFIPYSEVNDYLKPSFKTLLGL